MVYGRLDGPGFEAIVNADNAPRHQREDMKMTRTNPLRRSGTRLQRQGAIWLQQTTRAGKTFIEDSRTAGLSFAQDMGSAGDKLITQWTASADAMRKAVLREALDWQKLVIETRDGYAAAIKARLTGLESQATSTAEALKPAAIEASVLESTKELLSKAQHTVDQRLDKAMKPKGNGAPKTKRATKAKAASRKAKAPAKSAPAPIRNYDQLSAKDVVSRVQRLSGPQATAVLDYERSRKKRATVIRAVEKRLAAAS